MDFLTEFNKKSPEDANAWLFDWIENRRCELFQQLKDAGNKPLKFWSYHPGDPNLKHYPPGHPAKPAASASGNENGGYVYLLTSHTDIKTALAECSMLPHRYSGQFILAIDEKDGHDKKRQTLVHHLQDAAIESRMDAAVEITWRKLDFEHRPSGVSFELDVKDFIRKVVLRFTGSYIGIPEDKVFKSRQFPGLETWGEKAFEEYIWKIHARHFVKQRPDARLAVGALIQLLAGAMPFAGPDTVLGRIRMDPGAFSDANPTAMNKAVLSNVLGSIQGTIDNVTINGCYALNQWLLEIAGRERQQTAASLTLDKLKAAASNSHASALREYLHQAHQADTPSPFLPRYVDKPDTLFDSDGTSLHNKYVACAIGAGIKSMPAADLNDPEKWDIRMGYGAHDCIGKYLGDELALRALRKLLTLSVLENPDLQKQWGWIIKKFTISAQPPAQVETKPTDYINPYIQPFVTSPTKRTSGLGQHGLAIQGDNIQALTRSEISSLPDSFFSTLDVGQIIKLGTQQIASLNPGQAFSLQRNIQARKSGKILEKQEKAVARQISYFAVQKFANAAPTRPHPYSLWSNNPDTTVVSDYTSWPVLVDRQFTARHIKPADEHHMAKLPKDEPYESPKKLGQITALFKFDPSVSSKPSRSTMLFPMFAQWFTDSFLRTYPLDRRRNTSNHEVDMCQIYGLTESVSNILRAHDGRGKLKSSEIFGNEFPPLLFDEKGNIKAEFLHLPYVTQGRVHAFLGAVGGGLSRKKYYLASGLERGNSTFGYAAMSTLFLREHNRLCDLLWAQNPSWSDDRLFQTARMIVTLLELKIVIEEYVNHITAPPDTSTHSLPRRVFVFDNSYAEKQDWYRTNHIAIEFNLLYRWHSLVPPTIDFAGNTYALAEYRLNNAPLIENGLDGTLLELSSQSIQQPGLFATPEGLLAAEYEALKMGRDFRLRSFNDYRSHFGLSKLHTFAELAPKGSVIPEVLEKLYSNDINRLDFLVGLYAEAPTEGRVFGELMSRMVAHDAFTQVLTNPLLAKRIFSEDTLTSVGMETLEKTESLHDVWIRNKDKFPTYNGTADRLTMDFPVHGIS